MKNALDWFPLHVDSWLFGSTRNELDPAQRGVFVDLLALSMKDEGYVRANEDTPYPLPQLAGLLFIDPDLLAETIEICIRVGKIARLENGTLRVTSFEKYQLSRMGRWRAERRAERQAAASPTPPPSPPSSERGEDSIGEDSVGKNCNRVGQKRNTPQPSPTMRIGAGPRSEMTEEKIQTYKPSVAREIRTAGQAKGLEGPALEEFVNKRLAAWEADQRKGVAR